MDKVSVNVLWLAIEVLHGSLDFGEEDFVRLRWLVRFENIAEGFHIGPP